MAQIIDNQIIEPLQYIDVPSTVEDDTSSELYWQLGIVIGLFIIMTVFATMVMPKTNWF